MSQAYVSTTQTCFDFFMITIIENISGDDEATACLVDPRDDRKVIETLGPLGRRYMRIGQDSYFFHLLASPRITTPFVVR